MSGRYLDTVSAVEETLDEEEAGRTCLTLTRIELRVGRMTAGPVPAPALTARAPCAGPAPAPPAAGWTTLPPPPAPTCTGPPAAAGCFPRCTADCPPAGVPWRGVLVEKAVGVDGRADEDEEAEPEDADAAGGLEGPDCALIASVRGFLSSQASLGGGCYSPRIASPVLRRPHQLARAGNLCRRLDTPLRRVTFAWICTTPPRHAEPARSLPPSRIQPPPHFSSSLLKVALTLKLVSFAHSAISLAPPLFLAFRQICLPRLPSFSPIRLSHTMADTQTGPPTHIFDPLSYSRPDGGPGGENGAAISALFAKGGPGTTVLLRPRATYVLYSQIDMSHPGTTLATEGYPDFESGNQAVLETRGENEAGAVLMFNLPRCALKRVHVRGCRAWGSTAPSDEEKKRWKKEGRLGWIEGGGALIWMGGPEANEQIVEGCRLEDPRGWTCVRSAFADHCDRAFDDH